MAAQVTLMSYLQYGPARLPLLPPPRIKSLSSVDMTYSHSFIESLSPWSNFNIHTVMQQYGPLLDAVTIENEYVPNSPPGTVNSQNVLRSHLAECIHPRIRRSLRAAFQHKAQFPALQDLTTLSFSVGQSAMRLGKLRPDFAYFDPTRNAAIASNRAPGLIKPSWEWKSAMVRGCGDDMKQYKQVLSEVIYHMRQHETRYGFILTDQELVVLKRVDAEWNLEAAAPVPWTTAGTSGAPRLTVCLALWYLGMLAAHDQRLDSHVHETCTP